MLLAPFVFLASFVINCAIVPVIDVFMLCFDLVAYLMTPKANDEDSNPLNNRFINFLLQYRTLRLPMEVLMQSLPQAILALVMWQFLKRHPPSSSTSSNEFSDFAVAQALVASLANLTVNGITLYLSTKVSGRTWMRYMVMACKFEGSAMLPPEWDDRTTSASTVIDGNYHALKLAQQMKILQLAQQMKILQTVVRRDTITLRTPGVEADATWMKAHNKSVGDVVIENRKAATTWMKADNKSVSDVVIKNRKVRSRRTLKPLNPESGALNPNGRTPGVNAEATMWMKAHNTSVDDAVIEIRKVCCRRTPTPLKP
ncbi:hypothetical protein FOA52_004058 [Chlamydomonas sp. UWO 241]|nr:hypothetical protein FOA52_004058 [Chlamydomonas sp. UWO 241]